ncbi:uncharacterized protein EKO05_0008489 [Ascochyta rabiei]|uniref:uncharacterized protein n=1 Tax=Didymella rabiei TaxID=5454 RepID=UPI0021FF844F|nr:uncharacterized protein EKO05_0008489 [Ascochyta rabiei]UPX18183.1 hypothetical protein EKO05_0008489 [Ascochyta rabiei]
MSALDILREALSAQHDLVTDCDTDAVSVTSTDAGSAEPFYTADCIIAEIPEEESCYLVKWEDWQLHDCTWEPPANLEGSDLVSNWEQVKQELGEVAFRRENEENMAAFENAVERAGAAKERRREKREKKRRRLKRQSRPTIVPDDDSSDEEPLGLARARTTGDESLFVEAQEPSDPASLLVGGSHARQPPVPRAAPLQQSSEEESGADAQSSDDSLLGELQKKTISQRKLDRSVSRPSTTISLVKPEHLKKTGSLFKAPKASKADMSSSPRDREGKAIREQAGTAKSSAYGPSTQRLTNASISNKPTIQRKVAVDISGAKDHGTVMSTTGSKTADVRTPKPNAMRAIRTAPPKQTSRAIRIIDQPREQQRKSWSTDHHYNKLKFRGIAERRSRTEGTPDFNELDFVNGPPPTLPKWSTSASTGDPYGRRDMTNRRVSEEDLEDRPRRGTAHDPAPLAEWETDKIPQMCASWRLSSNCPHGPQKCRFMHRDLDPMGRQYSMGDINGWVPFKYRNPPITCPFWYEGRCNKTPEQCKYAHENTGWAEHNGEPIRIHLLPKASTTSNVCDVPPHLVPFKHRDPPVTCTYWLRDPHGCIKSQEVCKYAHWNTGWAPPETDNRGQPVQIVPSMRPRGGPPKYADPPVTCPFWLRAEQGCTKPDDECRYAHRNTGWAPPGLSALQAERIDGNALPCSQRSKFGQTATGPTLPHTNSDGPKRAPESQKSPLYSQPGSKVAITCPSWLRDTDGCPKSKNDCEFQHRNTGWCTPKNRPFDLPVPLDPNQVPRSVLDAKRARTEPRYGSQHPEAKNSNPSITCRFWLRHPEGCIKSAQACKFAHVNTGWLSQPGKSRRSEKLDPLELPRSRKLDPTQVTNGRSELPAPKLSRAAAEPDVDTPDLTPEGVESDVAQASALFAAQGVPPMQSSTVTASSQLSRQIEQLYKLNMTKMFGSSVTSDYILDRKAMLLYHPEEHSETMELITRWLLMHKVEVGNLWYDGSWSHFQQEVVEGGWSGIIVVHPNFELYTGLPGFGQVLKNQIRVWSVGLQPPSYFEPRVSLTPAVLRHDCINVFPHGGFIYITDDVLEQTPQLVLSIVKLFFAKIEQLRSLDGPASPWYEVYDACLLWRLCVRPELMEYLFQKCQDNTDPDHPRSIPRGSEFGSGQVPYPFRTSHHR